MIEYIDVSEVIDVNEKAGQFYFSPATLHFFQSRIDPGAFRLPDGRLIFTESLASSFCNIAGRERKYCINAMHPVTGDVTHLAEFKRAGERNKALFKFLQNFKGE